jgi:hypothetical protein
MHNIPDTGHTGPAFPSVMGRAVNGDAATYDDLSPGD